MALPITSIKTRYPVLTKGALVSVYLLFHLLLLRPVRTFIFSLQLSPGVIHQLEQNPDLSLEKKGSRLVTFKYTQEGATDLYWHYKVPFGYFFLFGMIGLILTGAPRKLFFLLIFAHGLILFLSWIVFSLDFLSRPLLLYIPDFLSVYLAPLSAFGLIPLSLMTGKKPKRTPPDV